MNKKSPTRLDTTREGPLNDLVLAINHYVSTGDHIGEGVAMEGADGRYIFTVPYDPAHPDDRADAQRLRLRVSEIAAQYPDLKLEVQEQKLPGKFDYLLLFVSPADVRRLAAELVRSNGDAGWGTSKPLIDEHFPYVRAKILSGEGV